MFILKNLQCSLVAYNENLVNFLETEYSSLEATMNETEVEGKISFTDLWKIWKINTFRLISLKENCSRRKTEAI